MTADDVVFTYETVKENQAENENVDLIDWHQLEPKRSYSVLANTTEPLFSF